MNQTENLLPSLVQQLLDHHTERMAQEAERAARNARARARSSARKAA